MIVAPVHRHRRAYVCLGKNGEILHRIFLTPDEPDETPKCEEHGRMVRQPNRPTTKGAIPPTNK